MKQGVSSRLGYYILGIVLAVLLITITIGGTERRLRKRLDRHGNEFPWTGQVAMIDGTVINNAQINIWGNWYKFVYPDIENGVVNSDNPIIVEISSDGTYNLTLPKEVTLETFGRNLKLEKLQFQYSDYYETHTIKIRPGWKTDVKQVRMWPKDKQ